MIKVKPLFISRERNCTCYDTVEPQITVQLDSIRPKLSQLLLPVYMLTGRSVHGRLETGSEAQKPLQDTIRAII